MQPEFTGELRKKHCDTHQFAIIGYGKLGGRELGYESDLDLIFLYDDVHPDAAEIYARLAQLQFDAGARALQNAT